MLSLSQTQAFVPSGNAFARAAAAADDALGEVEVLLHQAGRADACLRLVGPASRAVEELEANVDVVAGILTARNSLRTPLDALRERRRARNRHPEFYPEAATA